MAVTRLKRKDRRNKARAANRIKKISQLTRKPVIKNLDADKEVTAAQPQKVAEKVAAAAASASEEEE